jgi:hypothetical protein
MTIERPMFPPRAESVDSFLPQTAIGQPGNGCRVSESRKPAEGLSRRLVLAGVASAAALPIAAAMPTNAEQSIDPIFAALDAFRLAEAAFYAERSGDIPDEIGDRWSEAMDDVIRTQPTTPAGLGALTGFARDMAERSNRDAGLPDGGWILVTTTIDDATRGMSGLQAWSPPNPMPVDRDSADPIFAEIAKFRAAKKKSAAAYARVNRLYKDAAENGLGPDSELKDRNAFVAARLGCDPDEFTDGPAFEYWDSVDDAFSTVPTTKTGFVALLRFAAEMNERDRDLLEENVEGLICSLNAAVDSFIAVPTGTVQS